MSRIRANTITNQNANGAPNFPNGITVTGGNAPPMSFTDFFPISAIPAVVIP